MKVLVCGSRKWEDSDRIFKELDELKHSHGNELIVIHGDAVGAGLIPAYPTKTLTAGSMCDIMKMNVEM